MVAPDISDIADARGIMDSWCDVGLRCDKKRGLLRGVPADNFDRVEVYTAFFARPITYVVRATG